MAADAVFPAMGSEAHVIVVGDPALVDHARRRIEDLEQRWSRFLPDSEISRLNAARGRPVPVSVDTFVLVRRAVEAWRATGGRFDPTVLGDVIRAGYDRTFQAVVVRPGDGVSPLRRNCGGIELDPAASTVTLPADAGFDPGGIGKGLAADFVVEELLDAGADGACVNLGGDLRAEGAGPDGRGDVAVVLPGYERPVAVVALAAGAVATSTTAKRAWTVDGEARHHLVDPATGEPLRRPAVAVTALAREASFAEVATKAALLAEPGTELSALTALGCDGLLLDAAGGLDRTAGLGRFLVAAPAPEVQP
jgi:thiamine biosynthesis lipoprotein